MRILLAIPPDVHHLEIYRVAKMNAPPLGLAWIAAVLERAGHKVKILDSPTLRLTLDRFLREVKSWKPDLVGLSLLTPLAPKGYKAIKALKEECGEIPVVAGGIHPTFMYEEALDHGADVVVRGEGEYTSLELVEVIEKRGLDEEALRKVRGIAFRSRSGETVVTEPRPFIENLDDLPWPARHLLPMDRYTLLGKPIRVAHVMAGRGCPYGCSYCTTSYFWGRRLRLRSARSVAEEIEHVVDEYKAEYVVFADDELTVSKKFVRELLGELKSRGLDLQFACGSRVDHLDRELLKSLIDSGCVCLYLGVESASQATLDKIGKRITVEQAVRAFRMIRELGGFAVGSFILGFPWETVEDMKRTIEFAVKLDPDYAQFTALTPYPGTPLFDFASENGLIVDWNWEHYTTLRPVMKGFCFTVEMLGRMLKYAYRKFYLRLGFVWREMRSGRLVDLIGILAGEIVKMLKEVVRGERERKKAR